MTVSITQSTVILGGNGVTTQFQFSFVAVSADDIEVIYTDADGAATTLLSSQYSIYLNPPGTGQLWGVGGFVTYPISGSPIASGTSITIQRIVPLTQTTSLTNQGDYSPTAAEKALDTLCMELQQVAARTGQFRGTWVTDTSYNYGDIVIDGANGNNSGNYYMCIISNTSTSWSSDLADGDWTLAIQTTLPEATLPLSITNGGTGQTNAAAALTALGGIGLASDNSYTGINDFTGGSCLVTTASDGDASSKAASTEFVNTTPLTLADGTTAITQSFFDGSTKVATTAYVDNWGLNLFPLFAGGFVNKFRNATMDVWQRGTSGTVTTAGVYTADGWIATSSGASVPWLQGINFSSNPHALSYWSLQVSGGTGCTGLSIKQRIESYMIAPLLNQQLMVQAIIYNATGSSITPTLTVKRANSQDNWTSTTTEVNSVSLQSCSNSAWTRVAYSFLASSSIGFGLEVSFNFGNVIDTITKAILFAEADIRIAPYSGTGLVTSPPTPEMRSIGSEYPLNQRYLAAFGGETGPIGNGAATSTTLAGFYIPFKVPMRAPPTGISINTVGNLQVKTYAYANIAATSALTFKSASTQAAIITASVASGLTSAVPYILNANTALAGNLLFTGAEL